MSKFKEDDRIRVVSAQRESYWYSEKIGSQYSLKDYTSHFGWSLKEDPCCYVREEDIELVKEENKMKFDMKTQPWFIRVNNKEEYRLIQDWLETNHGYCTSCGYHESLKVVTNTDSEGNIHIDPMWASNVERKQEQAKEIKLNFKTVVDSVEWPEVETEAQKELAKLQKQIEELSAQAEKLKASL